MAKKKKNPQAATIVTTRSDVARHFAVAERTVGNWIARGMPGRPGRYDLAAIAAWRGGRQPAKPGRLSPEREAAMARHELARAEEREIKVARLRGQLVAVDPARRLVGRRVHEARSVLDQLPDQILAGLPESLADADRRRVAETARTSVARTCKMLSGLPAASQLGGDRDTDAED